MNEELIRHQVEVHDKRLNDHSARIDELERSRAASEVKINNLCEKIEAQTRSINYLIGTLATALIGFFFYAIQTGLFK